MTASYPATPQPAPKDPVLAALAQLEAVVEANTERTQLLRERIAYIRTGRAQGRSYRDIVASEQRPGVVELVSASLDALLEAGGAVRRSKAEALHQDGMTMDQIAYLFGVSRQRVSALLRDTAQTQAD